MAKTHWLISVTNIIFLNIFLNKDVISNFKNFHTCVVVMVCNVHVMSDNAALMHSIYGKSTYVGRRRVCMVYA